MFITYGDSRIGLIRKVNEDYISDCTGPYFIVADGMGGYVGGQVASHLAVDTTVDFLEGMSSEDITEKVLSESVQRANESILKKKKVNSELSDMGTTMIVAVIESGQLHWAHVGDSRLYTFHDGQLTQLTKDHSFVMELLEKGTITEEEVRCHPRKNEITRAVGVKKDLKVDTGSIELQSGTLLLLCTDGLTGMIDEKQIIHILSEYKSSTRKNLIACGENLFAATYAAGARDNVSLILIDYWSGE